MSFHDSVARYRAKLEEQARAQGKRRVSLSLSASVAALLRKQDNASAYVQRLVERDQRDQAEIRIHIRAIAQEGFGDSLDEVVAALRSYAVTSPLLWDDEAIRRELPPRFRGATDRQLRAAAMLARLR